MATARTRGVARCCWTSQTSVRPWPLPLSFADSPLCVYDHPRGVVDLVQDSLRDDRRLMTTPVTCSSGLAFFRCWARLLGLRGAWLWLPGDSSVQRSPRPARLPDFLVICAPTLAVQPTCSPRQRGGFSEALRIAGHMRAPCSAVDFSSRVDADLDVSVRAGS